MSIKVTTSGPLFDGRLEREIPLAVADVEREVGQSLMDEVVGRLRRSMRRPTGRYVRRIRTDRRTTGTVVTDGGVIYGPWLEGVSRRNRASRFKGYAAFRKAAQQAERDAGRAAERIVDRHIGGLS